MKFKSPAVERTMTRLSQSIAGGVYIPTFLFLVIMGTDTGDSERPLVETHPLVYILAWPLLLWKHVLPDIEAYMATAISNFIIYSLLAYWFIRQCSNLKRLP